MNTGRGFLIKRAAPRQRQRQCRISARMGRGGRLRRREEEARSSHDGRHWKGRKGGEEEGR